MKKVLSLEAILGVFLLAISNPAWGYEAVQVTNGGTIQGEVKFVGSPPPAKSLEITKDKAFCGSVPDERYVVGSNKGIKNVVVAITGIEKGKAAETKAEAVVNNVKCRFSPRVQAIVKDQRVKIKNSDPILHNTHPYLVKEPKSRTIVNLALPNKDQVIDITRRLKRSVEKEPQAVVRIKCDAHEWMVGWLHVYEHPYFAVSDEKGAFTITDIPPGKYKIRAWHEALGEVEKEVSVPPSGKAAANFEFAKK